MGSNNKSKRNDAISILTTKNKIATLWNTEKSKNAGKRTRRGVLDAIIISVKEKKAYCRSCQNKRDTIRKRVERKRLH